MKVTLTVTGGPAAGQVFEFHQADTFLVGRSPNAHLSIGLLADRHVSRAHFLVDVRPPNCFITDLNSRNGTFVNGQRIQHVLLNEGDVIVVGQSTLKVKLSQGPGDEDQVFCSFCRRDVTGEARNQEHSCFEPDGYVCLECQKSAQGLATTGKPDSAGKLPQTQPVVYICNECGRDLTSQADGDGLAATFERAMYLCSECAQKSRDPYLGQREIDDFLVIGQLGQGGMGAVYKVVHQKTRRVYALKMILPELVWSDHATKLFSREMQMQSAITHVNLVRFIGRGKIDEAPYFVTEFLAAGDVKKLVTETFAGPLPADLAAKIAIQILSGLHQLHQHGLIHRDIKPSNCLLDRPHTEKGFRVKIADHGLVKSFEDAGNSWFPYTKSGEILGSFAFIPPEQITNYRFVKPPTDIYSAGATLYYMLSLEYTSDFKSLIQASQNGPGKGKAARHPIEIVLDAPQVPIRKRNPAVPEALAEAVAQAIEKDVDRRFQSAEAFLNALREVFRMEHWEWPCSANPRTC